MAKYKKFYFLCLGCLLLIVTIASISYVSFAEGKRRGSNTGYKKGYLTGQIELVEKLLKEFNIQEINNDDISHITSIKHIDIYSYEKNGVKTLYINK